MAPEFWENMFTPALAQCIYNWSISVTDHKTPNGQAIPCETAAEVKLVFHSHQQ
jgi:hypothetical protein